MVAAEHGAPDRKVVIDAGAAIRLQRLERFGGELYTTSGVLAEIKDEKARALLGTLPTELRVRQPLPQDVAYTKQFAKATGDLGFLSQNDLDLIALTACLHRETGGKLRDRPVPISIDQGHAAFDWAPARPEQRSAAGATSSTSAPAGDHAAASTAPAPGQTAEAADEALSVLRARADSEEAATARVANDPGAEPAPEPTPTGSVASLEAPAAAQEVAPSASEGVPADEADDWQPVSKKGKAKAKQTPIEEKPAPVEEQPAPVEEEEEDSWSEADDSEDGSSAGEWVTPDNMHRFGVGVEAPADDSKVTCATADYSVQNVLLQMGITPQTFDGYAVRSVKMWGLVCRGCFHFTRDTQKVFCPKCGNDTVTRVPILVDHDGKVTMVHNGRKMKTKGTIFSIPKPQGGRGWKPIFAEDEIKIGSRDREMRHLQKVANKEKQLKDPFDLDNGARAWYQRSTTGTGRMVGHDAPKMQAGYGRVNPNAPNFKFKNYKRR